MSRVATLRLLGVAVQLAGLVLVARAFELESAAFYSKILVLVLAGFVVHHVLPMRFRLGFFVGLSLGGILWVFGMQAGTWLIAIGTSLIALCHLPISFGKRVVVLLAAAIGLGLLRGVFDAPWPSAIWPILGSMFMFRLIAYMYDLRHSNEKPSAMRAAAYFFLLPNVVFPLFPVVDYATFRRTYFDQDAILIYQRGIRWMLVGMVHLLLYRVVYQKLTLDISEVHGMGTLVQYMVANFGLYLRVSGQFHLIVGMLHLFGFRLPETHRYYFLASSFTDFWRRINIYWKDFMTKVFYYPVYFRVRRWGDTTALVVATLVVFFITWATHSYQWFWILGNVLLSTTDSLFWGILAVLLVINSVREARRGRARSLGVARRNWRASLRLSARIIATFTTICVLWSLWTSPTLDEWLALLSDARPTPIELLVFVFGLAGVTAILAGGDQLVLRRGKPVRTANEPPLFMRQFAFNAAAIVMLCAIASPAVSTRLTGWSPRTATVLADLRTNELNRRDATLLQRGYYENLTGVNSFNSQLWEVYASRPAQDDWAPGENALIEQWTNGVDLRELKPNNRTVFHRAQFSTNQWGMRDSHYDKQPPPNTHRVALLGQSYVMGSGVADSETFESLVERRLNADSSGADRKRYEILNFGVLGYTPPQMLWQLENKVLHFHPDVAVYVAYVADARMSIAYLASLVLEQKPYPYGFLEDIARRAGVDHEMPRDAIMRRLQPYRYEVIRHVYSEFVRRCKEAGAVPVWFYLTPPDYAPEERLVKLHDLAQEAGFAVFDFSDVYEGHDPKLLQVAPWDRHPNAAGHRLIADRLHAALLERKELLGRSAR